MAGFSSAVASDQGMQVLIRGTQNSLGNAAANALTKDNSAVFPEAPRGILSGSVVAITGSGEVGAGTAINSPVGLAVNDAVGHAYESSSAAGSGKIVYICGAGTVVSVDRYEVGAAPIAAGDKLFSSANGFLINEGATTATVVAVVLAAPTASNPRLIAQLRI